MPIAAAGLLMLLAALASWYATRSLGGLSAYSALNAGIGALLLVWAAVNGARGFRGFAGQAARRVALRWTGTLASVALAVVALNFWARNWTARLDLTRDSIYTVSDQTREVCAALPADPEAAPELVFFEDSILAKDVRLLVGAYAEACPQIRIRDASRGDASIRARGVYAQNDTTVVACRGELCEPVGYPSERNLTSALARLARTRGLAIYFLVGHGEVDLASDAESGYAGLAAALALQGFTAHALIGPATAEIPEQADVLVAASPERDLLPEELAAIEAYLQRGGRLLALIEPGTRSNFTALLERWGFGLPDGVVIDQATSPLLREPAPTSLVVHYFDPYHPITRKLDRRTMVLMPTARTVQAARKPEPDDELAAIVFASTRAWLEPDVAAALAGRSAAPADAESESQLPLAAYGTYPRAGAPREARIVVIGDRDFVSNRLIGALYDVDLFLNAIRWLAPENETPVLDAKSGWAAPYQDPLTVQQTVGYFYFLAFALPELLLLIGLYMWHRRRA